MNNKLINFCFVCGNELKEHSEDHLVRSYYQCQNKKCGEVFMHSRDGNDIILKRIWTPFSPKPII